MSINGAPTGHRTIDIVYFMTLFFYSGNVIIVHFGEDVFVDAIRFDGGDDAEQGLADFGGVAGFEILLDALGAFAGLFEGGDDDGGGGVICELGKLAGERGFFGFEDCQFFEQCLGGGFFGEDICQTI